MVHCFTSISLNYLAKARVLVSTVKKFHPDWHFTVYISDKEPDGYTFRLEDEQFDAVVWTDELFDDDFYSWCFRHNVVEFCTAVKGVILDRLIEDGAEKVFYLDPDTAVLNELTPLENLLDEYDILLTPHQLEPEKSRQAIIDNELCSLQHGIYNLGFFGVSNRGDGPAFARWWKDRLFNFCYDDKNKGLFTDQKWCDFVPVFFKNVSIVTDPGYNVASWNISNRRVEFSPTGELLSNGHLLRFFHFTKLGKMGDVMTQKYARDNVEIYELWFWYKNLVESFTDPAIASDWWFYGRYSDGTRIEHHHRTIYRDREDLQKYFANPFSVETPDNYLNWLAGNNLR